MANSILFEKTVDGEYIVNPSPNIWEPGQLVDINLVNVDSATGSVSYQMAPNPSITQGTENLLQRVIRSILTIRGTNAYEPTFGSNFFGLYAALSLEEVDAIKIAFPLYLKSIVEGLLMEDTLFIQNGGAIAPGQRLQDLTLEAINYDETFSGWLITLKVITAAGGIFVFNLP